MEVSFEEPIRSEIELQSTKKSQDTSTLRGEIGSTSTLENKKLMDRPIGLDTTEGKIPVPPVTSQRTQTQQEKTM